MGARFTNHMVVSASPLVWDFENWRRVLTGYRIDGRPVFDLKRPADRARMEELMAIRASLDITVKTGAERFVESCPNILVQTAGEMPVTDDNMGSEWRRQFGIE